MPISATYDDPNGTPAEGSPAAIRAALRAKIRQMPAEVDHHGSPVTHQAAPATPTFDAISSADPATVLAVLKAAETLGTDHATVNALMDSQAFVNAVTGAAPDEITAAITARTTTAPRMRPNPAQGRTGSAQPYQPQTFEDRLRGTLDNPDTGRDGGLVGRFL